MIHWWLASCEMPSKWIHWISQEESVPGMGLITVDTAELIFIQMKMLSA